MVKRFMRDDQYVERRNSLIPQAEALADAESGPEPARGKAKLSTDEEHIRGEWSAKWNRVFHSTMDRLSAQMEKLHDMQRASH